jgi:hypothetical protein
MNAHPSTDPATMRRRDVEFAKAETATDVARLQVKWRDENAAALDAEDHRTKEVADLRARVAALERRVVPGGPLCGAIGEVVGKLTGQVQRELAKRIKVLEDRQLTFKGVHEPGQHYARGSLVVKSGGLWCCTAPTADAPGKSADWQLAVKSGTVGPAVV